MVTRAYDFDAGFETANSPSVTPPAVPGDVFTLGSKTTFTIVNNQSSAANITGLSVSKSTYRSFVISYQIYRSASGGSTRSECGMIFGITDGTNWEINKNSVSVPSSGDAGLVFSITSAGQLQYTSDDNGGSYAAANSVFSYEFLQLMGV